MNAQKWRDAILSRYEATEVPEDFHTKLLSSVGLFTGNRNQISWKQMVHFFFALFILLTRCITFFLTIVVKEESDRLYTADFVQYLVFTDKERIRKLIGFYAFEGCLHSSLLLILFNWILYYSDDPEVNSWLLLLTRSSNWLEDGDKMKRKDLKDFWKRIYFIHLIVKWGIVLSSLNGFSMTLMGCILGMNIKNFLIFGLPNIALTSLAAYYFIGLRFMNFIKLNVNH